MYVVALQHAHLAYLGVFVEDRCCTKEHDHPATVNADHSPGRIAARMMFIVMGSGSNNLLRSQRRCHFISIFCITYYVLAVGILVLEMRAKLGERTPAPRQTTDAKNAIT